MAPKSVRRICDALSLDQASAREFARAAGPYDENAVAEQPDPTAGHGFKISVLGPVTAWQDGARFGLGPARQRAVLGLLALTLLAAPTLAAAQDFRAHGADAILFTSSSGVRSFVEQATALELAPGAAAQDSFGPSGMPFRRLHLLPLTGRGFRGQGVTIAILDTGFETELPAFAGANVIAQYDFVFNDSVVRNQANDATGASDHGTSTWSLLAAHVPDNVSLDAASASAVGAIALQGVRQARLELGESVAVIGLGLLGQFLVQLCRANGCRVVGVDLDPGKCALVVENGAQAACPPVADEALDHALRASVGAGVDVGATAATCPAGGFWLG